VSRAQLAARMRGIRATRDAGVALVLVLGAATIVTLVVVALSGYALSGYVAAKADTDWNASVTAAQGGIDDYIARLNENETYWTRANDDAANPALRGWTPIPGSTNGASFRYRLRSSSGSYDKTAVTDEITKTGVVRLEASGRVDGEVRTVRTVLRRGRFFDFVYFSDYETMDPVLAGYSGLKWVNKDPYALCGRYNWADGWNSRDELCMRISWSKNDVIDGPFHTNDQFFVEGTPTFKGPVSSGCPVSSGNKACAPRKTIYVPLKGTSDAPRFATAPVGDRVLALKDSNLEIRRGADPALGGTGCLFTGPTRIVLKPNGSMAVHSPNTTKSNNCSTASSKTGIDNANAKLPDNGVIYVESLPVGRTPVNSSPPYVRNPAGITPTTNSAGAAYPLRLDTIDYDPAAGDLFVEGTLKGQLTLATAKDIVITGDLRYAGGDKGTDVLGLVADQNVSVYHPLEVRNGRYYELLDDDQMIDIEVWAAILSVKHSFNVQTYSQGRPRGALKVHGSIAQKWRGAYATTSNGTTVTGYDKAWVYDPRLAYLSPPQFLNPVAASWLAVESAEAPAAFRP
jgi:hypothetical protein